jgi:hypothetical protein
MGQRESNRCVLDVPNPIALHFKPKQTVAQSDDLIVHQKCFVLHSDDLIVHQNTLSIEFRLDVSYVVAKDRNLDFNPVVISRRPLYTPQASFQIINAFSRSCNCESPGVLTFTRVTGARNIENPLWSRIINLIPQVNKDMQKYKYYFIIE